MIGIEHRSRYERIARACCVHRRMRIVTTHEAGCTFDNILLCAADHASRIDKHVNAAVALQHLLTARAHQRSAARVSGKEQRTPSNMELRTCQRGDELPKRL